MSGLPREILKWMQSLDLSYSVKNVKRDFANGFLVAEILSRYYKSEVTMHSFDNGIGLVKRIENWSLLEKFFKKLSFPIDRATIDAVIHCKVGAAVPLMEQLYTLLTHKTIQASRPVRDIEVVPAFARPTASQLIKERMSEADLASHTLDASIAPNKAAQVLASHMQKLKIERETDPQRFQPKATSKRVAGATINGGASSSGFGSGGGPVQFKEVQVRQVDDRGGVLQLRASHVYHQSIGQPQSFSDAPSARASAPASPTPQPGPVAVAPANAAAASDARPVLATISQAIIALTASTPLGAQLQSSGKEPSLAYADLAATLPDEESARLLHALHAATAGELVEVSLSNPKEFWILSGWLFGLLDQLAVGGSAFYQAVQFFSGLGLNLVQRDPYVAAALFHDFGLARLLRLLRDQPTKASSAARLAYAFVGDDATEHRKMVEAIRGATGAGSDETANRAFFAVLAALAPYEAHLLARAGESTDADALLQTYLRFVGEGARANNTARVRALAVNVLAPLCADPNSPVSVIAPVLDSLRPLLPTVTPAASTAESPAAVSGRGLANDEWAIDAALLRVLACVVSSAWIQSTPSVAADVHAWIESLLHARAAGPTIAAGVATLVHVLGQQPALRRVWLSALLTRDQLRRVILRPAASEADIDALVEDEDSEENAAQSSSSVISSFESSAPSSSDSSLSDLVAFFCPSLRSVWHPLTVGQTLADAVRIGRLDNLAQGHIDLLACTSEDAFNTNTNTTHSATTPFPDSESAEWCRLFLALRDHLVVELCDAQLCEDVIEVLRRFLLDHRTSTTAQSIFLPNESEDGGAAPPPLYCIMRFMYPDAAEECQLSLAGFLEELGAIAPFTDLVSRNVQVFAENEPTRFADSPLVAIRDKMQQREQ